MHLKDMACSTSKKISNGTIGVEPCLLKPWCKIFQKRLIKTKCQVVPVQKDLFNKKQKSMFAVTG